MGESRDPADYAHRVACKTGHSAERRIGEDAAQVVGEVIPKQVAEDAFSRGFCERLQRHAVGQNNGPAHLDAVKAADQPQHEHHAEIDWAHGVP